MKRNLLFILLAFVFSSLSFAQVTTAEKELFLQKEHGPTVNVPLVKPGALKEPGDDCAEAIVVTLPAALPFTDIEQTNCGSGNNYDGTCLGYYDGGEDILYRLDVTADVTVSITLDPGSTNYTGIMISEGCPDVGYCVAFDTKGYSGGTPTLSSVVLTAANSPYYIMIDTWPSPDCIPSFDLTITEVAPPPSCFAITTFPYTEDFENGGAIPDCWVNDPGDAGGEWGFTTYNYYGPSGDHTTGSGYYALLDDYNTTTSESPFNLLTPELDFTAGGSYQIRYWAWIGYGSASNPIHIDVSSDGGATWTNDVYVHDHSVTNTWIENTVLLSAYTTNEVIVRFRGISIWGYSSNNSGVDDVTIELAPSCLKPSAQGVTGISSISADLGWIDNAGASLWDIELGMAGFTPTGIPTASGVTNPYNYGGLTEASNYDWYVRADCGGGDYSEWTGPHSFSTLCNTLTSFPFYEGFENGGSIPTCWSIEYESGTRDWTFVNGGGSFSPHPAGAYEGNYNAVLYNPSKIDAIIKLVSPAMDLSTATFPHLIFWHAQADWLGDQDELRVYYKTSASGAWTLIPGAEWTNDIPEWTNVALPLPEPSGEYYIAFEATGKYGYGVCIDEVRVEASPPVPVSDWAVYIAIFFITIAIWFRFRSRF